MGVGGQHHALDYPWEGDPLPVVQEPVIRLMQLMIAGLITELFLSYHIPWDMILHCWMGGLKCCEET